MGCNPTRHTRRIPPRLRTWAGGPRRFRGWRERAGQISATFPAATIALPATSAGQADVVKATLSFRGSVTNNPGRQTIQGQLRGFGRYDPIDDTAAISGSVRTAEGERPVGFTVLGEYPVQLDFRARRGDEFESDNFQATAILHRRSIVYAGFGKVALNRPVNPRRPGRQILRGRGRFDFND
jgi:hypothetical protein